MDDERYCIYNGIQQTAMIENND